MPRNADEIGGTEERRLSIHGLSIPAQDSACILSDDYWAMSGRKAKKANQRNLWGEREGEREKTVPTSSAILYRKHSPLVGQGKKS